MDAVHAADGALAQGAAKANYHQFPRRTYAVGTSNGGYQVRRAMEEAPNLFDGGVDWEGTYVDPTREHPGRPAAGGQEFPGLRRVRLRSQQRRRRRTFCAAGYPPDIVHRNAATGAVTSLWQRYYNEFWEVTTCQWQQRFDPDVRDVHGRARATTTICRA